MLKIDQLKFKESKSEERPNVTQFFGVMEIGSSIIVDDREPVGVEEIHSLISDHIWHEVYGELRGPICELVNLAQQLPPVDGLHQEANRQAGILFGLLDRKTSEFRGSRV